MDLNPPTWLAAFSPDRAPDGPAGTPIAGAWTFTAETTVAPRRLLGPVEVVAFNYTQTLSGFGKGSVTVVADSVDLPHDQLLRLWTWKLWAFYNGFPVWCGCPSGVVDDGGAVVSLTLTELAGYLGKRVLDEPAGGWPKRYVQTEQVQIAQELAGPVNDLGMVVAALPGDGFLRDRTYEFLEGPYRADLLTNLCQVQGGPEFRSDYYLSDAGRPEARLMIAYPTVGRDTAGLGVVVPGGALGYQMTWDDEQYRTRTYAAGELPEGAPEDAERPVIVADRPQPGVPRLDRVDDWPGTILLSTLTERANTNAVLYGTPALAVTARTSVADPPLASDLPGMSVTGRLPNYGVGDQVAIQVTDRFVPDGLFQTGRLAELSVNAVSGEVDWTVTVRQPPAAPRATLTGRIARAENLAQAMFLHRRGGVTEEV